MTERIACRRCGGTLHDAHPLGREIEGFHGGCYLETLMEGLDDLLLGHERHA